MQIDSDGRTPANDAEHEAKTNGAVPDQDKLVSLADELDAGGEDAPERKERGTGDDALDDGADGDAEDKPRKRSQSQRYRDRIARLSADLDAERRRTPAPAAPTGDGDL